MLAIFDFGGFFWEIFFCTEQLGPSTDIHNVSTDGLTL